MPSNLQTCPCQINPAVDTASTRLTYQACCQPYHDSVGHKAARQQSDSESGLQAEIPERLMRTRYSAFVLVKPEYIVATTLPAQQPLLDIQAIETWATQTDWAGLEIVAHTPKLSKRHAQVEFKAYFHTPDSMPDNLSAHHELSAFVKVDDKNNGAHWYFLDPTVDMSITQKQPCICGSGEKFKRCCGIYI